MVKTQDLLTSFQKAYEDARKQECEELHNAIATVMAEQKASVQNALFVLDIIRFELMEAKYKEIMGIVQLSDKPPIPMMGKK